MKTIFTHPAVAFVFGAVLSFTIGSWYLGETPTKDQHPVGYAETADEVHVHSDWLLHIDGTTYDLTDDRYQSSSMQVLHEHIHLHDNNDEVIHRHDHGVTLEAFMRSLGFTLTDVCITNDLNETFCSDGGNELMVFVNDERIGDFAEYVNQEEDRILIYYGDPENTLGIRDLLQAITDQSCIYSGTCPERGTPPPESCGITCEI